MNMSKLAGLLGDLSAIAVNPVFSGTGAAVSAALKLTSSLLARGAEGMAELDKFADEISAMVKDGRQPAPDELKSLRRRSDLAHAVLQGTGPAPTGVAATLNDQAKAAAGNVKTVPFLPEGDPVGNAVKERKAALVANGDPGAVIPQPTVPAGDGSPVPAIGTESVIKD